MNDISALVDRYNCYYMLYIASVAHSLLNTQRDWSEWLAILTERGQGYAVAGQRGLLNIAWHGGTGTYITYNVQADYKRTSCLAFSLTQSVRLSVISSLCM